MAPQESVARGAGLWPPGNRSRPPPLVGPRSSHKRPFWRAPQCARVTRVCPAFFPLRTSLETWLSSATVVLSSERVPGHLRRCRDAHGGGLCPRLDPGARPRLAARYLQAAGCARIYTEKASGAQRDRPQLQAALDYMRPDDTLVVWKLDRLARSLRQLLDTVEALHSRQIGLRSLTEAIDTSTPGGTLVFHLWGTGGI